MESRRLMWIGGPLVAIALVALAAPWGTAAEEPTPTTPEVEAAPPNIAALAAAAKAAQGKSDGPQRFQDYQEVTKDMQTVPGLIKLMRYSPGDKNRDPEKLLAVIPKALLNQDLLFATSISAGGPLTGFMWDDYLIQFQVVGDNLRIITPAVRYVDKPGDPVSDVIQRTYTAEVLAAVPVLSMSPGGDVVVDAERLLKSNIADVAGVLGGNIQSNLSTWKKVKNFPDNTLIEVELVLARRGPSPTVGVAYSFRRLPNKGTYKPREADPRVGYFLTAQQDWTKPTNERDTIVRYINRWKVEKTDPQMELSPPKEPITFIIEDTVPMQWRRWVREGIEEWNQAFEKIGFDRAVVAQQQTSDNEYAEYEPEDARYNFFRWIVSGQPFAMGPSRVDPRTGQILDADILFDDSFARYKLADFDMYAPEKALSFKGEGFDQLMREYPDIVPPGLRAAVERYEPSPEEQLWERIEQRMHEQGRCACTYGRGMAHQLAIGTHYMIATGDGDKKIPVRFIGEAIKQTVTHEVGHTLGLRHNFKASAWLSLEEINRRRNHTDEPTIASVMDYPPLMFFAEDDPNTVRHFTNPTIGPYDYWAIEYGYTVPHGKSEDAALKEILARCTEPGLAYATDQDTLSFYSPDPLTKRWDLGDDPVAWARSRVAIGDKLLANIREWAVQDGDPKSELTRAFNTLWWERAYNMQYASALVGGQYFSRAHIGDPNAPAAFTLVDPAQQRAALDLLRDTVFQAEFFEVDPALLNDLAAERWSDWSTSPKPRIDYPIHDRILFLQTYAMLDLMMPPVIQRIYDAELKSTASDKYTIAEHLTRVRDMVWSELNTPAREYTDAEPMIDSIRRNLQREHLQLLLSYAQASPTMTISRDIQSMVRLALRELSTRIENTMKNRELDFATRAHLEESKSRIDRVLEAQFIAR